MPLIVRWRGRRVMRTRRRNGAVLVRLAADPQDGSDAAWVQLTPEEYAAGRTSHYQPTVVTGKLSEDRQ